MDITFRQIEELGVVSVKGRIIRENQADLRKQIEEVMATGVKGVLLDFSSVDYMDSAGLGCCASAHKLLRDRWSAALGMFGASQNIQRMWKLIRLDLVIPFFKLESEGIAWLKSQNPVNPA